MSKISELSDGGSLVSSDYLIAVRSGGNVKVRMNQINVDQVDLGDNEFIRLGNSQDLTMVHTSTQSIINQAGIGDLLIQKAGATKLTINASGIDVTGSVTTSADVTISNGNNRFVASSTSAGDYVRIYGGSGTGKWDIYGNGANLRIGDNESAGLVQIDTNLYTVGSVGIGTSPISPLHVKGTTNGNLLVRAGSLAVGTLTGTALSSINDAASATVPLTFEGSEFNFVQSNAVKIKVDASGNVGIGTGSPAWGIQTGNFRGSSSAPVFSGTSGDGFAFDYYNSANPYPRHGSIAVIGAGTATADMSFWTDSGSAVAERMRIHADGKVVVGTVPGQTTATLNARFNGAAIEFGHGNNGAGYYGTAGSLGSNGHPYIGFSCDGEESVNTFTTRGARGNIITGDLSGNLIFAQVTSANATNQTPTERMRIDAAGNLLVSCTSSNYLIADSGVQLYQTGAARFGADGTSARNLISFVNGTDGTPAEVGAVQTNGSSTSYLTSSDRRLKENIADADDAGSKIDAIQVRKFDWKSDGSHQDYGMVAQELLEVAPEAVSAQEDPEKMMGVDYSKLVPMMLKEIQSLRARVAQLES